MKSTPDVNSSPYIWLQVNQSKDIDARVEDGTVAPFPPEPLMYRVSGLRDRATFALHGCDFFTALGMAAPKPLNHFESVLDFGVGSGRLARMFKGFNGSYVGADIDHELLRWVEKGLPWVTAAPTEPRKPLPFRDGQFDCVISISVFTHMNEADCLFYLKELRRVTRSGGTLLLTVHGTRAVQRILSEPWLLDLVSIPRQDVERAREAMQDSGFLFVRQDQGHLTTDAYDYGITFTAEKYVRSRWSEMFSVKRVVAGGIHDFQDIVVLERTSGIRSLLSRF